MLKISIVTVSYNMEEHIEQTILSILNQKYSNLEYIIIDGGSTDETCTIINKYRDKLSLFLSEPDNGMYDAIAKGFCHATGDIYAWLNADDIYLPWTLNCINAIFSQYNEVNWVCGIPGFINNNGYPDCLYSSPGGKSQKDIAKGKFNPLEYGCLQQESMFWRSSLYKQVGGINSSFKLAGDYELWTRFATISELTSINAHLALFRRRLSSLSRSQLSKYNLEIELIQKSRGFSINPLLSNCKYLGYLFRYIKTSKSPIIYITEDNRFVLKKTRRPLANISIERAIRLFIFKKY